MRETIQMPLLFVEGFFILYMIGYASFLFLSVAVGSLELYAGKRRVLRGGKQFRRDGQRERRCRGAERRRQRKAGRRFQ